MILKSQQNRIEVVTYPYSAATAAGRIIAPILALAPPPHQPAGAANAASAGTTPGAHQTSIYSYSVHQNNPLAFAAAGLSGLVQV